MGKPKIRFEGYSEDWEQRKLGELGTVQTCKRIFKEQTSEQGDIPFFKNGTIGLKPDSYISREVYEEFRRLYPYPEVGDTLISVVGSIGRTAEYTGKDEYFQDSNVVWLKTDGSINKKFLKVSYQVIKWLIEGSTVKHLYNDNILRSEIIMPSSQIEQAKIAEFFEALDHLITLHQRKYDETKTLKKYMLQKMFPQNGEKVPEIRFDGFTEDWEQRKLGEVFEQTSNLVNPKEDEIELWSLTVEDGLTKKSDRYNREFLVKKDDNFKEVRPGDIVYNPMNMTLGAVGYNGMAKSVAVSGYYTTMVAKENYDTYYINTWLKSPQAIRLYRTYATGSLIEKQRVQFPTLSIIPVAFPKYKEQTKIGSYFHSLDNLITLHQRKCNELKEIKKYMLQNMFV